MSWRIVTRDDFKASLSEQEIRVFGQNEDADDTTIEQLIANTVASVRGYIRAGRRARLSPTAVCLPDMLIGPAMDVAVYNLLKRFNRVPNEARRAGYDNALALFKEIAAGKITPEDYDEQAGSQELLGPVFSPRGRLLGRQNEAGL